MFNGLFTTGELIGLWTVLLAVCVYIIEMKRSVNNKGVTYYITLFIVMVSGTAIAFLLFDISGLMK